MRSMLVSLSPKECVNLLNGDLSILIRKIKPKCDLPIDVYIYCTKEGGCIGVDIGKQKYFYLKKDSNFWNGKVVAKFTFNKVEEIEDGFQQGETMYDWEEGLRTKCINIDNLLKQSCLTRDDLYDYVDYFTKKDIYGYAWHIDNLVIFDEPKELNEFEHQVIYENVYTNEKRYVREPLRKAPKNYCYIEV